MLVENNLNSPFNIGGVKIPGRLLLAPMDGFTDSPFRRICRELGASLLTSEFLNGIDIHYGHPHLKYKTYFHESEKPFCFQIFDDDAERLLESAVKLADLTPEILDINMGCSARKVSNRGAGAGLLKHPAKIKSIVNTVVSALPIPITAKIRLGWDEYTKNYLEIASVLVESGISAITVHARTRKQQYTGSADWDAIAAIKNSVPVPVIGNGDVKTLRDAIKLMEHTGCEAVMIGRAALGNPWVFSGKDRSCVDRLELLRVLNRHLSLMTELYTERTGTLLFRKHLARYLPGYLATSEIRSEVFSINGPAELLEKIRNILFNERDNNGTNEYMEQ